MRPISASQSTDSSKAFFSNPFLRLEKVTCRLVAFSIRFSCVFPLTIVAVAPTHAPTPRSPAITNHTEETGGGGGGGGGGGRGGGQVAMKVNRGRTSSYLFVLHRWCETGWVGEVVGPAGWDMGHHLVQGSLEARAGAAGTRPCGSAVDASTRRRTRVATRPMEWSGEESRTKRVTWALLLVPFIYPPLAPQPPTRVRSPWVRILPNPCRATCF
ncbi:hypothetical protein BHM03_00055220, partial [Ensete ventricosum]